MSGNVALAPAVDELARVSVTDEHNQKVLAAVRPSDWVDPAPPRGRYNVVVIGAGSAGLVTAAGAAGLGARVALIERDRLGGDCLNVGCVPSKALISAARVAAGARAAGQAGVTTGQVAVDFAAVMERMRSMRAHIAPHDSAERFRGLGVDVYLGQATFVSRDAVEVGGKRLRFARAVVATGGRAFVPPIPGLADAGYLTNENIFDLVELPQRLTVIGGGPIGCELAQSFARFGSQVTIIDMAPQLLGRDDPDAAKLVSASLERDGVTLVLGAKVDHVETDRTVVVSVDGGERRVPSDAILIAAGRLPNVEGLGLDVAGVEVGRGGIVVDDRLRSSNRRIYGAGDVASRIQFTHAADAMARMVLRNSLFFGRQKMSGLVIPYVTYTDPELAHVGLTASAAADRGVAIDTFEQPLSGVDRAILEGYVDGFVRVHVRKASDRIVGATLVGPHAGELVHEIALAMTNGLGLGAIGATIHAYPTQAMALRQVADQYSRTRLTPFVARLMRWVLSWRRR